MRITLVQSDIHWENPGANLAKFEKIIRELKGKTEIVLLSEMFSTGFSMKAHHLAEDMNGNTVRWMKNLARENALAVAGSIIVIEDGKFYNRFLFVEPGGNIHYYDKRHLFRMSGENEQFSQGDRRVVVEYEGFRFLLQTCYDLRFPVFMRSKGDYDVILVVASWPESRVDIWKKLIYARAIENLCYIVALNRVGADGLGYNHSGESTACDYRGRELAKCQPNKEEIITVTLSKPELDEFHDSYPAMKDWDDFELKI